MPAWGLAVGYLAISWLGLVATGVRTENTPGIVIALLAFAVFALAVAMRGRQVRLILGTVVGTTGTLIFIADVADIGQPWRSAMAAVVPFVVYVVCDLDDSPSG